MKPYPNEELDRMSKREIIRLYKRTVEQFNDAVPVRHGHWIGLTDSNFTCSECKETIYTWIGKRNNYCPNCGAKMDEGK